MIQYINNIDKKFIITKQVFDRNNVYTHDEIVTNEDILKKRLIQCINFNFNDNYVCNMFTFDYLKNLLYEREIYNDEFADEVELK